MRPKLTLACASLALFTAVAACASPGRLGGVRTFQDRITPAEIRTAPAQSAYEIVSHLRPEWLRPSPASGEVTLVYLDGRRLGGLGTLQTLTASGIRSMRWLDGVRAATILQDIAGETVHGAILISTSTEQ